MAGIFFNLNDDIQFLIGDPPLEVTLNPVVIDIPDCGVTYNLIKQDGTQYDQDVMTLSQDPLKLTVIAKDDLMAGDYPLRLQATLNANPAVTAQTDFLLTVQTDDPCFGTEVQSSVLPDYEYDIQEAAVEQIATLTWGQTFFDCWKNIEYTWTLQDGTNLDPDIFTIRGGDLTIQTNDDGAVKDYPVKVSAIVTGYPDSEAIETFNVAIIDTCAETSILADDIADHQYICWHEKLTVSFNEYEFSPPYCPHAFTYSALLADGKPLPDFIKFNGNQRTFEIYSTDNKDAGNYLIHVIATNDATDMIQNKKTPLELKVHENRYRISENSAPYFENPLENQSLSGGQSLDYKLPLIQDDEGDQVTMKLDLGSAITFVEYDKDVFSINPGENISGVYEIKIILTDQNTEPLSSEGTFSIVVLSPETDQEDRNQVAEEQTNNQNNQLNARITSVSRKGLLELRFNQEIIKPQNYQEFTNEKDLEISIVAGSGESDLSPLDFNWEIVEWGAQNVKIQLNFDNPLEVSSSEVSNLAQLMLRYRSQIRSLLSSLIQNTSTQSLLVQ